jgi:hypothetical protein
MSKELTAFKLVSGEEVIGYVTGESDDAFKVESLLALYAQPGPQGVQVQLIPFMMSNQDAKEHTLQRTAVVVKTKPSSELEQAFLQASSGIDLTTKLPG